SDPNQISIVLSNLITNAVKYHRLNQDDPYIRIRFKRISDTVIFTVEDNGQGIHPHSVNKIVDMFFRASQGTDGTGLGLYIVKEALAKVKGKIDVESEFGKGTTFTVTLENAYSTVVLQSYHFLGCKVAPGSARKIALIENGVHGPIQLLHLIAQRFKDSS